MERCIWAFNGTEVDYAVYDHGKEARNFPVWTYRYFVESDFTIIQRDVSLILFIQSNLFELSDGKFEFRNPALQIFIDYV